MMQKSVPRDGRRSVWLRGRSPLLRELTACTRSSCQEILQLIDQKKALRLPKGNYYCMKQVGFVSYKVVQINENSRAQARGYASACSKKWRWPQPLGVRARYNIFWYNCHFISKAS